MKLPGVSFAMLLRTTKLASIGIILLAGLIGLASKTNYVGYKFYSVLTGSMEPALQTNSLIVVQKKSVFSVGDIVTFKQPGSENVLVTHRIIDVIPLEGRATYKTKGDANPVSDPWSIEKHQIEGVVVSKIPLLGVIINFLNTKIGMIMLVILPIMLLVYQDINALQKGIEDWRLERKLR